MPATSILITLIAFPGGAGVAASRAETNLPPVLELHLNDYLELVHRHNEAIQAQMLEAEASRLKARAEYGAFEPDLATSITREANKRRNNTEQAAAQSGTALFDERNTIFDSGLESLMPTGAKIRLGYTLSDLVNNVNPNPLGPFLGQTNITFTRQYQAFLGVTFTQPLLKNAGSGVTLAGIRLAALDSDIAFQQYRRELMLIISQAEAAYWNLYFAQEQLRSLDQSVAVAESLFADARERFRAGQGAELDVLEAQSGLALRRTKQNTARLQLYEALGRVRLLCGSSPPADAATIRAVDVPEPGAASPSYPELFQAAFDSNPDYLIQHRKVKQQGIRLGVAKNQQLPELNLRGAYGYNGLGKTPGDSWDDIGSQDFPSWSVMLELRLPLEGGIKARNERAASRLMLQEAVVNLNALQSQLANALNVAVRKTHTWQESIESYQTIVRYNENLLKTELARFNVGRVEGRKVLEVEADLFDARQNLADALVQYKRAVLERELAEGSLLKNRNLEITRCELQEQTQALLRSDRFPLDPFQPTLLDRGYPLAD